ncbi:amino-acid permease BAT1 homolog isoform X2 [Selaginella moellendorffii]|uniref:amino-acid permease BAT1 homolog isoform X2 n=1 Tax=Selaginella moellendorffii TaxID=88036 RepID=UPI000D1CB658|nr:amino-acid permease BAT1 homolog isoform X2 [Selaginella moellendorffii]|eukprot:XP_024516104.1 amino-acid permease BAT1 homolog isoform X2 [Selaginella moellendorffii]
MWTILQKRVRRSRKESRSRKPCGARWGFFLAPERCSYVRRRTSDGFRSKALGGARLQAGTQALTLGCLEFCVLLCRGFDLDRDYNALQHRLELWGTDLHEICSAFPTSGGLYFWSFSLAGENWGPFAAWITGWFNIVGQWAVTTSIDFSLATLLQVMVLLGTGGANGGGYYASKYVVIGFHAGILFLHGLVNSLPIHILSFFGTFAAFWNLIGVFVLMILIPVLAPQTQSPEFVFKYFNTVNNEGIHSYPYIFLLGILMSQYTLTGYDASAHMSEETRSSDKNGAFGIISAVVISVIVGWGYILGITFAISDIGFLLDPNNDAKGYAVAQLFYTIFKDKYGTGTGGIVCLGIVAVAIFFCGMSSVTSNSRMAYAFSRDGAMPLSSFWHTVNSREVPLNAVWLSVVIAFCMALPYLGSSVAFQAMVSIATIGLYIAYALPIFFRVTIAAKSFIPGPFNLGPFGFVLGWVSVLWVATITVLFCLPVAYPVTETSLNYAPVAVGGVLILVVTSWLVYARHWFRGPVANIQTETEGENGSV